MATLDLRGQRFGRLVAIQNTGRKTKSGNFIWICQCDCGKQTEANTGALKTGQKISCGCYKVDRMSQLNKTHGGRNERLYLVWMDMRRRCNDKKDIQFSNYGARGISVCKEWEDYANFRKWAEESGYNQDAKVGKCTLDRIDTNKGYSPDNCRWVDMKVQNNNRRNNLLLTYNGKTQTAAQWERELGLYKGSVSRHIRLGWSIERTLGKAEKSTA